MANNLLSSALFSPASLRILVRGLAAVVVVVAVCLHVLEHSEVRGDFPVHYSGAVAVWSGQTESLYEMKWHAEAQRSWWPSQGAGFHPFVYPPHFAAVLAPLAAFSASAAQIAFLALTTLAFLLSVKLAQSFTPLLRGSLIDASCVVLLFAPVAGGLLSSQNTPFSMLCISGFLHYALKEDRRSHFISGLFLGLWAFKPHYSLIFAFFLILRREWPIVKGYLLALSVYALLGVATAGAQSYLDWINKVQAYLPIELEHNSYNLVSINGFLFASLRSAEIPDYSSLSQILALLSLFVLSIFIVRRFKLLGSSSPELRKPFILALGPMAILLSSHAHYYDAAIAFYPVAASIGRVNNWQKIGLILLFAVSYLLVVYRASFPASPIFILLCAATSYLLSKYRSVGYSRLSRVNT